MSQPKSPKEQAIEAGALALAKRFSGGWHMTGTIMPSSSHLNTARTVVDGLLEEFDLTPKVR